VAVGAIVAVFTGFTGGGSDLGCIPVMSAKDLVSTSGWTEKGWEQVSPGHGPVDSVLASSSTASTVYVTTADRELFIGSGSPVVWRKRRALIPGRLYASVGTSADTLYAAQQALYRSQDEGRSWRRLSCGLVLNDVAISSAQPRTIYLAADPSDSDEGRVLGGLYRTTDGGRTWKRFTHFPNTNPAEPLVRAVAVSPTNPRHVVIGIEFGGALISTDGGQSWRFSPVADVEGGLRGPQVNSLAFGPRPHPELWLGSSQHGIFRADENGRLWSATGFSLGAAIVVPDQANPRIAYAMTSGGPRRTVDNGIHWQPIRGLPTDLDAGFSVSARGGTVYSWAGRQLFRSRDHGATWIRLTALPRR
jgi:hypothetical protein